MIIGSTKILLFQRGNNDMKVAHTGIFKRQLYPFAWRIFALEIEGKLKLIKKCS